MSSFFPLHLKFFFLHNTNIFLGPKFDIILNDEDVLTGYNFRNFGGSIDIGIQSFETIFIGTPVLSWSCGAN